MECNREEALRAMEVAEQKFLSKDFVAARKFALKAQKLFPSLENIAQMIAVMDVHVAAHSRHGPGDEKDWYGILQVEPTADDASVKKQYRKLALFLHPDKNKSIGAEAAFKLIGEALQVLSDQTKRMVYDAKTGVHNHASGRSSGHHWAPSANGHASSQNLHHKYPDGNNIHFKKKVLHHYYPPQTSHTATLHSAVHLFTFWTACSSCQMRYQYLRKYENQNLLCPQCRKPFIAKDLSNVLKMNVTQSWPPQGDMTTLPGVTQSWRSSPYMSSSDVRTTGFNCFASFANGKHDQILKPGNKMTSDDSSKNRAYVNVSSGYGTGMAPSKTEAENELFRKIEELQKARKIQKELKKKAKAAEKAHETLAKYIAKNELFSSSNAAKKKVSCCGESVEGADQVTVEAGKAVSCGFKRTYSYSCTAKGVEDLQDANPVKKPRGDAGADCENTNLSLSSDADMNKRLAEIAKKAIRMQLSLQASKKSSAAAVATTAIPIIRAEEKIPAVPEVDKSQQSSSSELKKKEEVTASCSVPDADFHNFDEGREEKDVAVGQIWALYDDKDGMPKYYVRIKEVRSRRPFKVVIVWFEPMKPSEELCELLDTGFSVTCGEFGTSSSQVFNSVNSFSHLVRWEKGSGKGTIKVYPKKGEVWALYEDWDAGQQVVKVTADAPALKCCMVVVVSECDEVTGVTVMPMQKVQGFKTVFQLALGKKAAVQVPFKEILRFSHRVPAYKMNGDEGPGIIPRQSWELDPAAVPLCLI